MRNRIFLMVLVCLGLVACGVPREVLMEAQTQAFVLQQSGAEAEQVRAALLTQAEAWDRFAQGLEQRTWGGIRPPTADFVQLVARNAAIAHRLRDLINQQQDDPATNQLMLKEFGARWQQAADYLSK